MNDNCFGHVNFETTNSRVFKFEFKSYNRSKQGLENINKCILYFTRLINYGTNHTF